MWKALHRASATYTVTTSSNHALVEEDIILRVLLCIPILKLPRLALAVLGKGLDDRYSPYRQSPSVPTIPVANALGVMYTADDSVLTGIAVQVW